MVARWHEFSKQCPWSCHSWTTCTAAQLLQTESCPCTLLVNCRRLRMHTRAIQGWRGTVRPRWPLLPAAAAALAPRRKPRRGRRGPGPRTGRLRRSGAGRSRSCLSSCSASTRRARPAGPGLRPRCRHRSHKRTPQRRLSASPCQRHLRGPGPRLPPPPPRPATGAASLQLALGRRPGRARCASRPPRGLHDLTASARLPPNRHAQRAGNAARCSACTWRPLTSTAADMQTPRALRGLEPLPRTPQQTGGRGGRHRRPLGGSRRTRPPRPACFGRRAVARRGRAPVLLAPGARPRRLAAGRPDPAAVARGSRRGPAPPGRRCGRRRAGSETAGSLARRLRAASRPPLGSPRVLRHAPRTPTALPGRRRGRGPWLPETRPDGEPALGTVAPLRWGRLAVG